MGRETWHVSLVFEAHPLCATSSLGCSQNWGPPHRWLSHMTIPRRNPPILRSPLFTTKSVGKTKEIKKKEEQKTTSPVFVLECGLRSNCLSAFLCLRTYMCRGTTLCSSSKRNSEAALAASPCTEMRAKGSGRSRS